MTLLAKLCMLAVAASPPASVTPQPAPTGRALLVGCTRYPALPPERRLAGPGNDVLLFESLLTETFNFPGQNIVTLREGTGREEDRPTRAHIEREFKRLAAAAGPQDQVVIFLAGHGSQQPNDSPSDPADLETDGLDEVFCPADIEEPSDDEPDRIPNAITDDEIRTWLEKILDRGARVWLIVDACHSGTMGRNFEQARQIPAGALIKEDRLLRARQRAAAGRASADDASPSEFATSPRGGGLIALYAAQPDEVTVERRFPPESADAKSYGLLSYTLNQVLRQSTTPLTYRELVQRIHGRYVQMGRTFPTPLVEGKERDREVLGLREQPGRSRITLHGDANGQYTLDAGSLSGLSPSAILAVFPSAGQLQTDDPLGHVRVTRAGVLDATATPCAYGQSSLIGSLPSGGRCEVVYVDHGLAKLSVAVDDRTEAGESVAVELRKQLHFTLQQLGKKRGSLVEIVEDPARAEWLVRVQSAEAGTAHVILAPAAGWTQKGGAQQPQEFGPAPVDRDVGAWLEERLASVARATNLLRLAEASQAEHADGDSELKLDIQLLHFNDENDPVGRAVSWGSDGIALQVGDILGLRAANKGRTPVDLTFLFVDSSFGIDVFFPESGLAGDGRLLPGATLTTPKAAVTNATTGLEHMLVIAVKASPQQSPIDFSFLAQSPLAESRGSPAQGKLSPLERLLKHELYGNGTRRGVDARSAGSYELRVFSWHTVDR